MKGPHLCRPGMRFQERIRDIDVEARPEKPIQLREELIHKAAELNFTASSHENQILPCFAQSLQLKNLNICLLQFCIAFHHQSLGNHKSIHFVCLGLTDSRFSNGSCLKRIDHGYMVSVPTEKTNQVFPIVGSGFQANQQRQLWEVVQLFPQQGKTIGAVCKGKWHEEYFSL